MTEFQSFVPWVGLAVAVAALFLRGDVREDGTSIKPFWVPLLIGLLSVGGAALTDGDLRASLIFVFGGVLLSSVASIATSRLGTSTTGSTILSLGVATFLVSTDLKTIELSTLARFAGMVVGLCVGSLPSIGLKRDRSGLVLTSVVFVAGTVGLLSRINYRDEMTQVAPLLLLCAVLAVLSSWAIQKAVGDRSKALSPALGVAVLVGLSWLALSSYLGEGELGLVALASLVAVLASAWALPIKGHSLSTWGLVAVVWLGLATFAFSSAFGLGMGVAAIIGVSASLALRRFDLLPAAGMVAGLAAYRLFRENNDVLVRAFDIGQHYAMIGLILGIVVLVAVADAVIKRRTSPGSMVQGALVGLMATAVIVGASVFFGPKGAVGVFVGLAVAPMVAQLTSARPPWTFPAAAALMCAVLMVYQPVLTNVSLEKDAKVRLLVWLVAGIGALYVAYGLVGRKNSEVASETV